MNSLDDALNMALDMEKKGYDLYKKASQKTLNKLGKTTLEAIARKELDHINAIEEFAKHSLNKAIEMINPLEKIDYVKPIMDKLEKELNENEAKDMDLEESYKAALKLEKDSYDLYKGLSEKMKEDQAKKFFQFLMGEENTHYELLNETLEYLDHPANWYREQEKWIVEG